MKSLNRVCWYFSPDIVAASFLNSSLPFDFGFIVRYGFISEMDFRTSMS